MANDESQVSGGQADAQAPQSAGQAPQSAGSVRRAIASAAPVVLLVALGALGYFGMTYVGATMMEDLSTAVLTAITFGATLVGIIVGGIVGSKIKQFLLR